MATCTALDVDGHRAQGNNLYRAGDFAAAADAYSLGLRELSAAASGDKQHADAQAALLCNRAACYLEQGYRVSAVADAQACLLLQPINAKAHYRLARALPRDDPAAAPAVAAALALLPPPNRTPELLELYAQVQQATADAAEAAEERGELLLQLPTDPRLCGSATTEREMNFAVQRLNGTLVVLHPGVYTTYGFSGVPGGHSYSVLGLGNVELRAGFPSPHAVYLSQKGQSATFFNVRMTGGGGAAAVCVSMGAVLRMLNCRVQDYKDIGVLVVHIGSKVELDFCSFERLELQAIEVREGGALSANRITIDECRQGVVAYGGARSIVLRNSSILRCRREGILVAGTFTNAATEAQPRKEPPMSQIARPLGRATSLAADSWGRKEGIKLEVTVLGCTIAHSGCFGISADSGAHVVVHECRLELNDPFSAYIKGGTDVSIIACQLIYSGKASKSGWAGSTSNKQAGIEVAVNYGGNVEVAGSVFVGPEQQAIIQAPKTSVKFGLWTKPVMARKNIHLDANSADKVPTTSALALKLPAGLRGSNSIKKVAAAPLSSGPPISALLRPCRTFPSAAWAPTSHEFYVIGNTLGYDVTGGLLPSNATAARILLGACGDFRNLLATVHAVAGCGSGRGRVHLSFVMNDGNLSMLARTAVLLHLAAHAPVEPAELVLAVWADHSLSAQHSAQLFKSLSSLADGAWPAWLSAAHELEGEGGAAEAERALRLVFRAWASCTMSQQDLLAERNAMLEGPTSRARALALSMTAVQVSVSDSESVKRLSKEVAAYVDTGSLGPGRGKRSYVPLITANPTFLLAPELQYTAYFSSSIFRALPLGSGGSAQDRLIATLSPQLESVLAALQDGLLVVKLVPGDILSAMTTQPVAQDTVTMAAAGKVVIEENVAAEGKVTNEKKVVNGATKEDPPPLFDFIDCSNVADYVSLSALVQAAAPLLACQPHARLRLESIVLFQIDKARNGNLTPTAFAAEHLGIPHEVCEELLGLRWVGGHLLPSLVCAVRLEWAVNTVSVPDRASWMTATNLLLQLLPMCKRCTAIGSKAGVTSDGSWEGAFHGAPLTLVHLLCIAAPQGAKAMLQALLRCDSGGHAALFNWELTMHSNIHTGHCPPLRRLLYPAKPGIVLMLHHTMGTRDVPLVLAISSSALANGAHGGSAAVKQLISSFAWDEEQAEAHWLLPASVAEQRKGWYVTLCMLHNTEGLLAVGVSTTIGSLKSHGITPPAPWRTLPADLRRHPLQLGQGDSLGLSLARAALEDPHAQPLTPPPTHPLHTHTFGIDLSLLDQAGAAVRHPEWQGAVHCGPDGRVVVDVLAPGSMPSAEKADVTASIVAGGNGQAGSSSLLRVSVVPKRMPSTTATTPTCDEFDVQLPPGVEPGMPMSTKLSRKLGVLSTVVTTGVDLGPLLSP